MPAPAYTPLISTRITVPPLRPHMVGRERLWDLLDDALSRPLTLISAPAGFGKTTLITSWLSERPRDFKVAWVSLDADDTDPAHFLYYLIASLQSVEPRVGRAPISLIGSLKIPSPRDLIALLLNELSQASDTILLVLDDYHLIRNADVDASLAYLVEQMPSTLRLIIATREDPGLPIARWRSLERVVEIGMEELRFSYEEAVVFFRQTMGLNIDSKSAHALEDRTEGWIAAMQMAALSLRLRGRGESLPETAESVAGFSGRHRYMVDYMAAEVLRRQSDDTRAFLHRTAVLDRFSAPLCDALTGRSDSKEVLARLEQSNMFLVPLDGDRTWYRYHQLFADFLRSALSAAEERELHQGASRWYEANGFGPEAIRHSLAASDVDGTVRLVRALAEETLSRGEFPTLLNWLSRLPESAFRSNSDLAGYKAWLLYMSGRSAEAETYATLAQPQGEAARTPQQAGISLALRSFLALNWSEPQDTLPLARQALDELDDGTFFHAYALCLMGQAQGLTNDRRAAADTLRKAVERARRLGNHLMTLDSLAHLATIMNAQGKLREAIVLCRNAIEQYSDTADNPLPIAGLVCVPLGALLYETDDLPSARRYLTTGIELCGQLGMSYFKLAGLCALAKLQHACGERDEAWTTLAAAREISDRPQSPRRQRMATIATAELQLREANVEAAARTLESARSLLGAASEQETLMNARLLLAQHNPSAAWKLAVVLEEAALQEECEGSLVAILVLEALCKRALGQHAGAEERLESAISRAASAGYRRVFLDEGATLTPMLERMRHVAPEFVASLLEPLAASDGARRAPGSLPEPLNKTEIEILTLLNRGLTNQEIADQLTLTVGTTKWRMNQIFGKLQVRNRIEALVRARQLKLL